MEDTGSGTYDINVSGMLKKICIAFIPPTGLFLIHVFLIYAFDIYQVFPWFDIPMHFFGGGAIGITTIMIYRLLKEKKIISDIPAWLLVFLGTAVVVFVAVGWEFGEFTADYLFGTMMQPSLPDTMLDLFLGMLGGACILVCSLFFDKRCHNCSN